MVGAAALAVRMAVQVGNTRVASCAGQSAERETEGMVRALGQRGLGARWPLRAQLRQ